MIVSKLEKCIKCEKPHRWNEIKFTDGEDWIVRLKATLCPVCEEEFKNFLSKNSSENGLSSVWVSLYNKAKG